MISLRLGVRTLAATRWSVSPAMEAMAWLILTANNRRHVVFGDPGPVARGALRNADVSLIVELLSSRGLAYMPDMLTPTPRLGRWHQVLSGQLAEVESSGPDAVETQVLSDAQLHQGRPLSDRIRRLADAGQLPRRLAAGIAYFWRETLQPEWPALQTVIDTDIASRGADIARNGLGDTLARIHPKVDWADDALIIDGRHDHAVDLTDQELVLSATMLSWPTLLVQIEAAAAAVVYYPVSQVGTIGRPRSADLADVVGAVRAALLADLRVARFTTELAARHRLAASTVSYHLDRLHRAGLVSRHRDGRRVLYQRTARADTLTATE